MKGPHLSHLSLLKRASFPLWLLLSEQPLLSLLANIYTKFRYLELKGAFRIHLGIKYSTTYPASLESIIFPLPSHQCHYITRGNWSYLSCQVLSHQGAKHKPRGPQKTKASPSQSPHLNVIYTFCHSLEFQSQSSFLIPEGLLL